ncbi:MAG: DUF438 domain-containing protein [bacterium]
MKTDINTPEFTILKDKIKIIMKALKAKENSPVEAERLKQEFKEILEKTNPLILAMAEGELVREGFTRDDLMTACDVHLSIFKDAINKPNLIVAEGHPVHRFQEEHKVILKYMETLIVLIRQTKAKGSFEAATDEMAAIKRIAVKLMEAENHNVRQENTLFPVLEKHGIIEPPVIMWAEHTEMKSIKKQLLKLLTPEEMKKNDFAYYMEVLAGLALVLTEKFGAHTQKETNVLYAVAMDVITEEEWKDIKEECDNLGYFES